MWNDFLYQKAVPLIYFQTVCQGNRLSLFVLSCPLFLSEEGVSYQYYALLFTKCRSNGTDTSCAATEKMTKYGIEIS
ncbi:MAG: hypothetical protein PWR06_1877 [Thermoanaerobacteraceae bacterium]|nr:hypothetical protein [Thermoanaerobacteraceae bacterium]